MLQRPAAILGDISARLLGSNNTDDSGSSREGHTGNDHNGGNNVASSSTKKRLSYPPAFIERRLNNRSHVAVTNTTSSTGAAAGSSGPADDLVPHTIAARAHDESHQNSSKAAKNHAHATVTPKNIIPEISIAPTNHRENTAFHALRDTFVFPSLPSAASLGSLLPSLPTIPCMSGLGQSNLFSDGGRTSVATGVKEEGDSLLVPSGNAHHSSHFTVPVEQRQKGRMSSSSSSESEGNPRDPSTIHPTKAGSLFLSTSSKHDSFDKLEGLNVTMLGGYRGSILRDAHSGRRLWVPLKVGFNVRKAELAIGLTEEDELRSEYTF